MRRILNFDISKGSEFKEKLLAWSQQFLEVVWLDSNEYPQKDSKFEAVLAAEAFTLLKTDYENAFEQLNEYQQLTKDWLFGYLSYDLKNDVENLRSNNFDGLHFPDLYFFQPQKLIFVKESSVEFHYLNVISEEIENDFEEILKLEVQTKSNSENIELQPRIDKNEYLQKVENILEHIHRGDIYETNFCQEFFAEGKKIETLEVFSKLNQISKPPFACYLKFDGHYLLSASPERYLTKSGDKIISQPIKGTARRSSDPEEDLEILHNLKNDIKERAENIMIVDLVRNDLSRIAVKGSVEVEELCEIYSFEQVHQMISTVTGKVDSAKTPVEILKVSFPMGSMTGAPKISAMKIMEELEVTKRGLYSGAVGYFTPNGDFDFNVVIRSILYNEKEKYVSVSVGGAITSRSQPQLEYEECLLKLAAMKKALSR